MIDKIVTAVYLAFMAGILISLYRQDFSLVREDKLRKLLTWLCTSYVLAVSWIFIRVYEFKLLSVFTLMLAFCPFIWFAMGYLKRHNYEKALNLFLCGAFLSSIGLVTLYRTKLTTKGILSKLLSSSGGQPVAMNHLLFTVVAIIMVSMLLSSGVLTRFTEWSDKRSSLLFWGVVSLVFMLVPFVLAKAGLTKSIGSAAIMIFGKSGQPSELGYRILFSLFIAKFISKRPHIFSQYNDTREMLRVVGALALLIAIVFFMPLTILQHELGTSLLMAFVAVSLVYLATQRAYILVVGFLFIVLSMGVGTLVSDHVGERIIGSWLNWDQYISQKYSDGSNWPAGKQIFDALSGVRASGVWGVGLAGVGPKYPKVTHMTTDFIAVPIMEELGIIGLALILGAFLVIFRQVTRSPLKTDFRGLLLVGFSLTMAFQAFYNLSVVCGMLPMTGVPISFISNGGTQILVGYLQLGIMVELLQSESAKRSYTS